MDTTGEDAPQEQETREEESAENGIGISAAVLAESMRTLIAAAEEVDKRTVRGSEVRQLRDGDSAPRQVMLDADGDPRTQEILRKVLPFLDSNTNGPVFAAAVRGKLFIGFYPRHQQLIDVEQLTGLIPGSLPNTGQVKLSMIGELLKCVRGWIPAQSPEAELLRAQLHDPEKWPKLHEVDWMVTRDPFVYDDEIKPLFRAYTEWKAAVSPTKEEFDFYYSLIR